MKIIHAIAFALAVLTGSASGAKAMPVHYVAELNGAAEVPSNASLGTGSAWVTFDADLQTLRVEVDFVGLSAGVFAAHIHGPASLNANAGVAVSLIGFPFGETFGDYVYAFDLTQPTTFLLPFLTANGGTAASASIALGTMLSDGLAYINLHTEAFPGGEIRGQLTAAPVPLPAGAWLLLAGLGVLSALRRMRPARAEG